MTMYVLFVITALLCAVNVALFVATGNPISAAAAVFIALLCVRQAVNISYINGLRK